MAEVAVDVRRVDPPTLSEALARRSGRRDRRRRRAGPNDAGRPRGRGARPRDSVIWRFNRLFWQQVSAWEVAAGRRFEEALPSGQSDASHPEAVADSVADFWTLLRDLEKKGHLPAEVFALEIGVGIGATRGALARPLPAPSTRSAGPATTPASGSSWATTRSPR